MHLKKLEVQGFKSFADKTVIDFKKGITCIVGPNGSGKSNVSDAIRWVLGEQSVKTLRGNKMEDIIFAGTDKRKPLGFGEVTIVFDNKEGIIPIEYSEVSITRRMFRSGESEYYINKTACRLKDIKELFMDTGVGKDGYSIIGQGRVDEILSTKPDDRRNIFEEAAGIVKYKTRKEKAEKKLSKTEENLIRINDIVFELEKQLEPLKKQSYRAKEYMKMAQSLKELDINVFIREIDKLNMKLENIGKEKNNLEEDIKLKLDEKAVIKEKYNELKNDIDKMDKSIEEIQNERFEVQKELEQKRNQLILLDEKEKYGNKEKERLEQEVDVLEKNKFNLIDESKRVESVYEDYNKKLKLLKEEFKREHDGVEKLENEILTEEESIEENKGNIINTFNSITDKKGKISNFNSFEDNINKRIHQVNEEIKDMKFENKDREKKIDQLLINKKHKIEEIKNIKSNMEELVKSENILQKNLSNLYNKSNENIGELQGKKSNYKFLVNMDKDYEGFYKSVKNVMQACENNPNLGKGVLGVVADLLKVEKKYEKAIEIALGSSIQNIVTDTEENAKKIICFLKEKKLGRVTFLPLTSIRGRRINLRREDIEKFKIIGIASDLILFDDKYKNIFDYLLGRTIVVENIDWGIKAARRFNYSNRFVTLDGDLLNPGGSITGGSTFTSNTGNILNRKARILKLEEEINEITNIQSDLDYSIKNLKDQLKEIKSLIIKKEDVLQKANIELIKLEKEVENLIQENEKSNVNIEKLLKEINDLESEKEEININREKIVQQIEQLEVDNTSIQEDVKIKIENFEKRKLSLNKLKDKVTSLKIKINSFETKSKLTKEKLKELEEEIDFNLKNILDKQREIDDISDNIIKMTNKRKNILLEIESLSSKIRDNEIKLKKLKDEKTSFMDNYYMEQDKLNNIIQEVNYLDKKISNLEIKETRYSVQLENYNNKILEDYEMTYDEGLKYKKEVFNLIQAKKEIKELKKKIRNLGTINLAAIEEFEKLKDRFVFMDKQRIDLTEGKESLKEVIEEMEDKMEEQFVLNFNEVRKNFVEVFSELFGGGEGDIYLEDEENPLTSGIEIIAQPPGKKPQSLSLLSGGEKSLTAVALLFAILKTKPTPFCILDEIDAALDEANINRYAKFLKDYAQDTQFIIITHRKGTMEIGDILYGVTMEEEGISKVVSIKLKDKYSEAAS